MTRCLVCESTKVELFLDLGVTALANKFLAAEELGQLEPTYPLRVGRCRDCTHVQLMEHVPPAEMFTEYLYMSSASDTLRAHLDGLSEVVVRRGRLGSSDLVIDIGCNDGTLLTAFSRRGVKTLGVDPAKNLAALAKDDGVARYIGFFSSKSAQEIVDRWGRASAMTATNTFPHIPALRDFVAGIKTALAPEGVFVIEAHYLLDLLNQVAFDTVYHEHVSYWALGPMLRLFRETGLEVVDVARLPIHHGQLRVFVQHVGRAPVQPSVERILLQERAAGLEQFDTYQTFAARVQELKVSLGRTLRDLRAGGARIAGYGAPAKGNTLLSFLDLGSDLIEYIVDKSPLKQGRYTPGTHIPVVPPQRLLDDQPDYVVLLAWNFADEILKQQAEYLHRGGKFILPVPQVRIITREPISLSLAASTAEAT